MKQLDLISQLQPRGGGVIGPFIGASYPLRAVRLFQTHKTLRPFIVIPLVINILLGVGLYSAGIWWGTRLMDGWIEQLINWIGPAWLDTVIQALVPVIQAGLFLLLFVVLGLVLLQFGSLLGAPFYGKLSEKLEALRTPAGAPVSDAESAGAVVHDLWRAIAFELKKLLLLVGVGGLLFLMNGIPGVGTITASVGSLGLAVLLVCIDMLDAPLERRRLRFRQKLALIFRCFPASASFGLVCLGLISIPLMNLFTIPLCVSAGTLFFCDRILPPTTRQRS